MKSKEELEKRLTELNLAVNKILSKGQELTMEQGKFMDDAFAEMKELEFELQLYKDGTEQERD